MIRPSLLALGAGAVLALSAAASADSVEIGFTKITSNTPSNPAAQFKCVVSDVIGQPGQATFRFSNNVGINSSISEIYFDGPMLGIASVIQSGCNFSFSNASPGNLPGGQTLTPAFNATPAFSADANGNPANGINAAGEFLEMKFDLNNGHTFASIVSALETGALRIGLHVRAIGPTEDSEGFVNNPPAMVPVPPAAMAGGATLVGLIAVRNVRRRRLSL